MKLDTKYHPIIYSDRINMENITDKLSKCSVLTQWVRINNALKGSLPYNYFKTDKFGSKFMECSQFFVASANMNKLLC